MSKAFDMVQHHMLFMRFIEVGLSVIFVRLLLVIYTLQDANVRWNGDISNMFSITNRVRQGAILSGILYCFYCSELFTRLRNRRSGCSINNTFIGIIGYSDDNFLLSPSLEGLQDMLKTCEDFSIEYGLQFSTDPDPKKFKTKCISYLKTERTLRKLQLCGNDLPWVMNGKHVGNNIENNMNGMKKDMAIKRARYIDKNDELCQEFYFAHPKSKLQVNQIFNTHFTGAPLWNLFCRESVMFPLGKC